MTVPDKLQLVAQHGRRKLDDEDGANAHSPRRAVATDCLRSVRRLVVDQLDDGGNAGPIDIALEEEGSVVVARVHNLGEPISPDRLATVFEPFRRAAGGRNPAGLGLGLFIVQQIVAAHGGTVDVASTDAGGTTFALRLPKS